MKHTFAPRKKFARTKETAPLSVMNAAKRLQLCAGLGPAALRADYGWRGEPPSMLVKSPLYFGFQGLTALQMERQEKKAVKMEFLLSFNGLPLKTITLSTYGFLFSSRDGGDKSDL
jgi:hypothetical protein